MTMFRTPCEHRLSLMLFAFVTAIPTAAFSQEAAKARALNLSVAVGPAFALGKAAETWTHFVAERSAGTLAIDLHPGATLAQRDPNREFSALRDGAADLAVGSTLHWSQEVQELAVVGLPWLAAEPNELAVLATGAMRERLFAAIERAGAVPLAVAPLGHRAIAVRSKPVRVPDDLRGLRIRIASSPFLVDFYAGLGALPFALPFAEAAARFRDNELDAQEGSIAAFAATRLDGLGFHDVTLLDGIAELAVFAANRASWDALTADQRALVGNAAQDAAKELRGYAAAEQEAALVSLKTRDIRVLQLTASGRAAFAAAARPTYDRWGAIAGEGLVRAAETAVKEASARR
jgi:TRAP-type transport system periplasmic protein